MLDSTLDSLPEPTGNPLDAAGVFAGWHRLHMPGLPVQARQVLIAYASCQLEAWLMPTGKLPTLDLLMRGMEPSTATPKVSASPLSPPHETALAEAMGLKQPSADGLIPWAALEATLLDLPTTGLETGWAWITPCHWAVGIGQATFTHPAHLPALSEADSRRLLESMRPYWAEDGIALHYSAPHRWLAEGAIFKGLPTASLDQVMGRNIDGWLPAGDVAIASTIRRLQGEMQMLLYTHPVNDERSERRQLPINSFWISGTGDFVQGQPAAMQAAAAAAAIDAPRSLAVAFQTGNVPAFAEAWAAIDTGLMASLLQKQNEGKPVQLTLCGQRQAQTFASSPAGLKSTIKAVFRGIFGVSALFHVHEQL